MKKICVYLAVLLVLSAFGMTILAHAGDMPSIPLTDGTLPEVSTEYEITIPMETTAALTLSNAALTMDFRSSAQLTASVEVATWTSSNEKVVKLVQSDGTNAVLKAAGRGTATVTAQTADGRTAECTVTVRYTLLQWIIRIVLFGWIWYR
ncbi:MAG: hypothetical protein IJT44_04215 [Clostridia bacterium]|nr:hypothetical protein [Clostridia bacterium]